MSSVPLTAPHPPPVPSNYHHLIIQSDGLIIAASESTLLGHSSKLLLLTSAYSSIHPNDLEGLISVVEFFWLGGNAVPRAYFRRMTASGRWIWVESQVEEFVEIPAPGVLVVERIVTDEKKAMKLNLTMKVSMNLAKAVTSARSTCSTTSTTASSSSAFCCNGGSCVHLPPPLPSSSAYSSNSSTSAAHSSGGGIGGDIGGGISINLTSLSLTAFDVSLIVSVLSGNLRLENLAKTVNALVDSDNNSNNGETKEDLEVLSNVTKPTGMAVPPPVESINLSYTNIGDDCIRKVSECQFKSQFQSQFQSPPSFPTRSPLTPLPPPTTPPMPLTALLNPSHPNPFPKND